MEFCQGCGTRRVNDNRFCLQCGQAFPETGVSSTQKTDPGKMLSWAGPLGLIFFFLPWITVSCQMGGPTVTFSGWELANGIAIAGQKVPGQPILFLVPLASVVLLIMILAQRQAMSADSPVVFVQVGAAAVPLALMIIKYVSWVDDIRKNGAGLINMSLHVGFVLTALTFLCAAVGGFLNLTGRGRSPTGVPVKTVSALSQAEAHQPFCPECGTRNSDSARFCTECGCALA